VVAEQEPIKTAFYDVQAAMGATFTLEGGWYWTDSFGDVDAEYRAVREGVGMWDVSPLIKWDLRGPDAILAAQRVNSNDVLGMQVGQVRYGAFLDEDGNLVDDGTVYKVAEDHFWLMTNGMDLAGYFADSTKGMNVTIDYIAPLMPNLQVQGPRSRDVMSRLTDADVQGLGYYRFLPEQVEVGGVPVWLARTGFSGELGFEMFLRPENAADLWKAVRDAGVTPYANAAVEICRIESGMIVTGFDYEPHQATPFDVGLDRLVALDKPGEFLGKGRLAEVAKNPPNRFRTLVLEGDEVPEYGSAVTKDGEPIGTLTSPTRSPRFGVIGVAILRTDAAAEGNIVEVATGDGTASATVRNQSIYDPQKSRPRS
jgi:glycine cleavage system T protein (aminomethyltransferase)